MANPHPLFARIHARMCGVSELLDAGVAPSKIASLYPLTSLDLYRDFFAAFLRENPQKLRAFGELTKANRLADEVFPKVSQRITMALLEDDEFDAYQSVYVELRWQASELVDEFIGDSPVEAARAQLKQHLIYLGQAMLLLADWDGAQIENDFEELEDGDSLHAFFVSIEHLLAYWDIRARFDTSVRRAGFARYLARANAE